MSVDTARGPRRAEEIFTATLELLTERGFDGLTIEGVAARSGVNKTTIYRWWPSKGALLAAAILNAPPLALDLTDTGSLRGDLIQLVERLRHLLTGPQTRPLVVAGLSAAASQNELGGLLREFLEARLFSELPIFERATARGEISEDVSARTVIDLLAGALWVRLVLRADEAPERFADELVDTVLPGIVR